MNFRKAETVVVAPPTSSFVAATPNKIDIDSELAKQNQNNNAWDPNKIDIDAELANEILVEIESELVDGTIEDENVAPDLNEEIASLGSQIATDKISENLLHKILTGGFWRLPDFVLTLIRSV